MHLNLIEENKKPELVFLEHVSDFSLSILIFEDQNCFQYQIPRDLKT